MTAHNIPPRRIAVAVDHSAPALAAWTLARDLAIRLGCDAEAVHAYEPPMSAVQGMEGFPPAARELREEAGAGLRAALGGGADVYVTDGAPVDAILGFAEERGADLIVMGTHGRAGPARVLMGSVAEGVTRRARLPVLTVRDSWRPVRRILVAANFAERSLGGISAAAALAEALDARFDVLHVAEADGRSRLPEFEAATASLSEYFAGIRPRLLRRVGKPVAEIVEAALNYDLIVLTAHGRTGARERFLGTTAERVLRHAHTPVLAVPSAVGEPAALLAEVQPQFPC
ncbi:MAG: universal stress protein [Elusimicrobia bacterium]|nr:universal stress protein [Elusimicrobiota bacterium]